MAEFATLDASGLPRHDMPKSTEPKRTTPRKPSRRALLRAVASSTAVETGQPVALLERKLMGESTQRYAHIKLAR